MTKPDAARLAERLWYDRPAWLALPLLPLAWIYGAVTGVRRWLWRSGWLQSRRLTVPVVVVGNITVGGTGKTPVVEWLGRTLAEAGFRPGIASRGYGGRPGRAPHLVEPGDDPAQVGDEPLMLRRSTGLPVCVCRDRVAAGQRLVAEGVDVVIADDGLQHYRLARDLEIMVVDGERRSGNGWLLPAGPLREPAERRETVDVVLVNGGRPMPGELAFQVGIAGLVALDGRERASLSELAGTTVRVVAGIGNPGRFVAALSAAGLSPVLVPVPDHGRVDLQALCRESDRPIIMTAKDAVKYATPRGACPVWVATPAVRMPEDLRRIVLGKLSSVAR